MNPITESGKHKRVPSATETDGPHHLAELQEAVLASLGMTSRHLSLRHVVPTGLSMARVCLETWLSTATLDSLPPLRATGAISVEF